MASQYTTLVAKDTLPQRTTLLDITSSYEVHESHVLSVTFSHRMSSDASREINCYSLFSGCEIIAHEEEDTWSRVEGWWAPAGRDARKQGSVGGAALGCGVSGQEEEEVINRLARSSEQSVRV